MRVVYVACLGTSSSNLLVGRGCIYFYILVPCFPMMHCGDFNKDYREL